MMWVTSGESARVLLVEDAPYLRYAFGRLLRLHGFEVQEAENGCEALDCLATFQPELVITDLMMPMMDGLELISRLRLDPRTAGLPVVMITADATAPNEHRAREAGADEFLAKPIDLSTFLDRLRAVKHRPPAEG
jgi:CheY-like chemotaxis protein